MTDELLEWLVGLDEAHLFALLQARPDVTHGLAPADLSELAQRLGEAGSLTAALTSKPLPYLQLMEAAVALGPRFGRADLADLLADGGSRHRRLVDRIIDDLIAEGLLVAVEDQVGWPVAMVDLFEQPLRLGPPALVLLETQTVDTMRRWLTNLGQGRSGNRAATVDALLGFYADADAVRAALAQAPAEFGAVLRWVANGGDELSEDFFRYDEDYALRQEAMKWAAARGLLVARQFAYEVVMPAEVARALRGPQYRAPFSPIPPEPRTSAVLPEAVESDAAAAVTQFADHALAVLDHLARVSLPSLKTGGVGSRELTKLAKLVAADDDDVRLILELAGAAGLLESGGAKIGVSAGFEAWRNAPPAGRVAVLLAHWWTLGAVPTESRDADGKALRALASRPFCDGCRAARVGLLDALAGLDGGAAQAEVASVVLWRQPLLHVIAQDGERPFATTWREAERLAVIAGNALTELGRAVVADDPSRLVARLEQLLPESADAAVFGADLTVFVAGAPSGRVSALLDSAADRESRGGAVTWRFSPVSIRRALDDGSTGDDLLTQLAAIATAELPQPLRYLIGDVARRHGHIRVSDAVGLIRSDDEALLAEIASSRKLAKLGLRLVAPTVLAADVPTDRLIPALRAAGYFPVPDRGSAEPAAAMSTPGEASNVVGLRPGRAQPTIPSSPAPVAEPDLTALARALRAAGITSSRAASPTEEQLGRSTRSLPDTQIRQLAHAIDNGARIGIRYQSGGGNLTARVIDSITLAGGALFAWCELRQDDRVFVVDRIRAVFPV